MTAFKWTLGIVIAIVSLSAAFISGIRLGYNGGVNDSLTYLTEPSIPVISYNCGSLIGAGEVKILNWTGQQVVQIRCNGKS